MGTLQNQQPRKSHKKNLADGVSEMITIAHANKITLAEVIQAKMAIEAERYNDLLVADGDAKDEQLAGFGELLQSLIVAVEQLSA